MAKIDKKHYIQRVSSLNIDSILAIKSLTHSLTRLNLFVSDVYNRFSVLFRQIAFA